MKKVFSSKLAMLLAGTTLVASLTGCLAKPAAIETGYSATQDIRKTSFSNLSASASAMVHETSVQIPNSQQAVYTATVAYAAGDSVSLKFGEKEIFSISADGFRVCNSSIQGSYGAGSYKLRITANPTQKMLMMDVTLPDGGTLRRGSYEFLGGDAFRWYSAQSAAVTETGVTYEAVTPVDYEISTERPPRDAFTSLVYNLVSSFDDASTTRLFSWTARDAFLRGKAGMSLRYRVNGTTEWISVEASMMEETTKVRQESYFKVDLTGLTANTEYEYQIGVTGSESSEDWSRIYTFKTAPAEIDGFKFVAIGDTQATNWDGTTQENKGYTYCRTALDMAFSAAKDAAFILHTGDVTDRGSNLNMWNWYFESIAAYAPSIPHFATMGNHDTWVDDPNNYFAFHFNHPDNGANALDMSIADMITDKNLQILTENLEDVIYSYTYGDAHFIVLNSGTYQADDEYFLKAQRQWLINDLEANKDAKWKIILVHEPVYHRKGGTESRPWLYDVIEGYGVDLVIQGHSHLVTRTYPMKDGEIVTKTSPDLIQQGTGTVYTTIGSTTLNHDSMGANTVEECVLMVTPDNHQAAYTVVSVENDRLVMTIKQLNGLVVDEFTILAAEEPATQDTTAGDTTADEKRGGCSSSITAGVATTGLLVTIAAGVLLKKKDEDEQ